MIFRFISTIVILVAMSDAQTLVDLHTQAKSVDFSKASHTRPIQTGTSLPATCSAGELFFNISNAAGNNVFGCTATNTWNSEGSSVPGFQFQNGGVTIGTGSGINFQSGTGMMTTAFFSDPLATIQFNVDTAVIQTRQDEQSGRGLYCASAGISGNVYTCGLAPALSGFTVGMLMHWRPDADWPGGKVTLNVDNLGALPLKLSDGVTDPASGDIIANRMETLWYDGAQFRMEGVQKLMSNAVMPACSVSLRGRTWHQPGTTGVKDVVAVCAKDNLDVYAWRNLY